VYALIAVDTLAALEMLRECGLQAKVAEAALAPEAFVSLYLVNVVHERVEPFNPSIMLYTIQVPEE
jgi:hypothetical protein